MFVHTRSSALKNITLSAPADRIGRARQIAREKGETLNEAFRRWLNEFTSTDRPFVPYEEFVASLGHLDMGPMPSREERNARG